MTGNDKDFILNNTERSCSSLNNASEESIIQEPILSLEGVTKRFPLSSNANEDKTYFYALKDITFSLNKNDFVVLGGANGSGKSLLMTIIAGLVKQSTGKVTRKSSIGLVFQNPDLQILGETPWEDVLIGPKNKGIKGEQLNALGKEALQKVGLSEKAHFPSRSLSGGEKRRLATAGILALERDIIIFDEPYANLDYPGVQQVNSLLKQLHQAGKTLVVLTHELEKCLALATRFIVLYHGQLVFDDSPQEGLQQNLESWAIRNPLRQYKALEDLVWN